MSAGSGLMHSYHNVAELRQFRGARCVEFSQYPGFCEFQAAKPLAAAPINLDVEIPDLLPQRIAVEAEQVGGADLIAARRCQRRGEERNLDFLEDPVIEAGRRHAVREAGKMRLQISLDGATEIVDAVLNAAT